MSVGQGSVITQQRKDTPPNPGPPFQLTSADNGLSVDPGTFRIVLGNGLGGNAAALLNNREIPCDVNLITLTTGAGNQIIIRPVADAQISMIDVPNNRNNNLTAGVMNLFDGNLGQSIGINTSLAENTIELNSNQLTSTGINAITFRTGSITQFSIRAGSAATTTAGFTIEKTVALAGIKIFPSGRVFVGVTTPNPADVGAAAQLQIGGALQTAAGAPLTVAPAAIRFGGLVAAAAVLDGTQYIEVVHGGVLLKLALIV